MTRREALLALAGLPLSAARSVRYSFWVFGLLRPRELTLAGLGAARLHCRTESKDWILEPGCSQLLDRRLTPLQISGPENSSVDFTLEVPGVLMRRYHGTLCLEAQSNILCPIVTIARESAVSSIVGAELPLLRARRDALLAQAIVARSFLVGTIVPRHEQAFFCDTTHCQFLRSPALPASALARALSETGSCVLCDSEAPFAASYSAACGGCTEGGERDGHIYTPVECAICREHHLTRLGHGWGLCQEGAMGLAQRGYSWRQILRYYFPEASLRYI